MKKLSLIQKKLVIGGRFCIIGLPKGGGIFCWD